jgi:hypothetical protein
MLKKLGYHVRGNLVGYLALFIALGGTTYAATGGNFILGKPNSASSTTSLTAPVAGKGLQVTNTSTHVGAAALGLNVAGGHAPFTVNSGTKVSNLNADKLDGLDSTAFLPSSNVKSWHWGASNCTNATDPGCQSTFSFGGMSFTAKCFSVGGSTAHLELDNSSSSNQITAAIITSEPSNNAHLITGATNSPIFDLQSSGGDEDAQGSLMESNAVSNPDAANLEARVLWDGVHAFCGLQAVAVRSR